MVGNNMEDKFEPWSPEDEQRLKDLIEKTKNNIRQLTQFQQNTEAELARGRWVYSGDFADVLHYAQESNRRSEQRTAARKEKK
jgi:hypothetical protein